MAVPQQLGVLRFESSTGGRGRVHVRAAPPPVSRTSSLPRAGRRRRSLPVLWFRLAATWSEPSWLLGIACTASASWDAPTVWLSVGRCTSFLLESHNDANVASRESRPWRLHGKFEGKTCCARFLGSAAQRPKLVARNVFDSDGWRRPTFPRQSRVLRFGLGERAALQRKMPREELGPVAVDQLDFPGRPHSAESSSASMRWPAFTSVHARSRGRGLQPLPCRGLE